MRSALLATVVAAGLLGPVAAADASSFPQPLRDRAPAGTSFKDAVLTSSGMQARAASALDFKPYTTPDGTQIQVATAPGIGADTTAIQSYVDFLGSLPHGAELSKLRVYIVPSDQVQQNCGNVPGTLACYENRTRMMVVPGDQNATDSSGVTVSYVVAHEYGHHIAAYRSNTPFNSLAFGPKYWASYERVCQGALNGKLAPGNEGEFYALNPGENWAETYARLRYPDVPWSFAPSLEPDAGALAAARLDVSRPWLHSVVKTFRATFTASGSATRTFSFPLTLDGALAFRLHGPKATNFNFSVASGGKQEGATKAAGSQDKLTYPTACRERPTEHVTITVTRVSGAGPFSMQVTYAG